MGRVARSERTKSQLRAEARGLKRAKRVMARPAPKRKPVGVLAPGAKFNRKTGKITPPKPSKRQVQKAKSVMGRGRQTGPLLGMETRRLQAEARKVRRDRDELRRNQQQLKVVLRRDPAKAKSYTRVPLPKEERTAEGREFKFVEKKAPAVSRSYFDPITKKAKREAGRAERKLATRIQREAAKDAANLLKKPKRLSEIPGKRESAENLRDLKILSGESRLDRAIKREQARQVRARRKKSDPLERVLGSNPATATALAGKDLVAAIRAGKSAGEIGVSGAKLLASLPLGAGQGLPVGVRKKLAGRAAVASQELVRDPVGQAKKNTGTGAKMLQSIIPGLAAAVTQPVKTAKESVREPVQRWNESDEQFRKRVKKEGFVPELLDATVVVGGGTALASRALQRAAATGRLGAKAKRTAGYTRRELVSAGEKGAVVTGPSKSFLRNAARQKVDARRVRKVKARVKKDRARGRESDLLDVEAAERGLPTVGRRRRARKARRVGARDQGRNFIMFKSEQAEEVTGRDKDTIGSQIGRLSKDENVGYRYVAEFGIRDRKTFVRELKSLRAKMIANRKAANERRLDRGEQPLTIVTDQVAEIDRILKAPEKFFTPRVLEVAEVVGPKQRRLAVKDDPGVTEATVERRRLKPFEAMYGIEDLSAGKKPVRTKAEQNAVTRRAMRERGLDPELTSYFKNMEFSERGFKNYAMGGRRAVADDRTYSGELLKTGRSVSDARIVTDSAAGNLKRKYNWNQVAQWAERSVAPWSKNYKGKLRDLDREARSRGLRPGSYVFVDLRKIYAARDRGASQVDLDVDSPLLRSTEVSEVLRDPRNVVDPARRDLDNLVETDPEAFDTTGWSVVSKADYDELVNRTTPSGKAGRVIDMARGAASRWLLLNLPWLVFQTSSNSILSALAGVTPNDIRRAAKFFKELPPEERRALEATFGVKGWYDERPRGGAAFDNRYAHMIAAWKKTEHYRRWRQYGVPGWLEVFSRLDNMQNNVFRRALFYKTAKSEAFTRMNDATGRVYGTLPRLEAALGKKSHEEVMRAIVKERESVEQLGRAVDDWLGDWTSFTAAERKWMVRIPLFYGFIRFSTRLAFYTMPLNHPVLTSILLKLGDLSRKELEAIFAKEGTEPPPWEYGNFYTYNDATGEARRFTLSRTVPFFNLLQVTNQPEDVLNPQVADLLGLINPLFLISYQQLAMKNSAGREMYDLKNEDGSDPGILDVRRFRLLVAQVLGYNWYARTLEKTGIPGVRDPFRGRQQADSSIVFPRPKVYKRDKERLSNERVIAQQRKAGLDAAAQERFAPFVGTDPLPVFENARRYTERAGKKKKAPTLPAMPQLPALPTLPEID